MLQPTLLRCTDRFNPRSLHCFAAVQDPLLNPTRSFIPLILLKLFNYTHATFKGICFTLLLFLLRLFLLFLWTTTTGRSVRFCIKTFFIPHKKIQNDISHMKLLVDQFPFSRKALPFAFDLLPMATTKLFYKKTQSGAWLHRLNGFWHQSCRAPRHLGSSSRSIAPRRRQGHLHV